MQPIEIRNDMALLNQGIYCVMVWDDTDELPAVSVVL